MSSPASRLGRCALLALALIDPSSALPALPLSGRPGTVAARRALAGEIERSSAGGSVWGGGVHAAAPQLVGLRGGGRGEKTPRKTPRPSQSTPMLPQSPQRQTPQKAAKLPKGAEPLASRGERLQRVLAASGTEVSRVMQTRPAQVGGSAALLALLAFLLQRACSAAIRHSWFSSGFLAVQILAASALDLLAVPAVLSRAAILSVLQLSALAAALVATLPSRAASAVTQLFTVLTRLLSALLSACARLPAAGARFLASFALFSRLFGSVARLFAACALLLSSLLSFLQRGGASVLALGGRGVTSLLELPGGAGRVLKGVVARSGVVAAVTYAWAAVGAFVATYIVTLAGLHRLHNKMLWTIWVLRARMRSGSPVKELLALNLASAAMFPLTAVRAALHLFGQTLPPSLSSPAALLEAMRLFGSPRKTPRLETGEGAPLLFAAALYVAWVAFTCSPSLRDARVD